MDGILDLFYAIPPDDEREKPYEEDARFRWPPSELAPWYGECAFRAGASRSLKTHWGLWKLWDGTRERADTPADLVDPFDRFLGPLLGDTDDDTNDPGRSCGVPLAKFNDRLTAFSPAGVTALALAWRECADRVEDLRPAITAELTEYVPWFRDFTGWAELLQDWGAIVEEAERRSWGLFYLAD